MRFIFNIKGFITARNTKKQIMTMMKLESSIFVIVTYLAFTKKVRYMIYE